MANPRDVHLMVDIETLGQEATAVVVQIGAVAFSVSKGLLDDGMECNVSMQSNEQYLRTYDMSTLKWWIQQLASGAVHNLFLQDTVPLEKAMMKFSGYTLEHKPECVWAKPPGFDLEILRSAGTISGVPVKWSRSKERCARTIMSLATQGEVEAAMAISKKTHRALDDAKFQALVVQQVLRRIQTSANET